MNCQKSLTNFSKFLFLFVSALALFQAFLYAEDVFFISFSQAERFFIFSSLNSFIGICNAN